MNSNAVGADPLHNYFIFWNDVKCLTNSSEATIRRAIKRNQFPAPVPMFGNKGRVGFRRLDIHLWCEGRWSSEGGV
tara:strand:+ start:59 stop:286 length:228 start_codon:yes stop_codon:yes gene_type:complete